MNAVGTKPTSGIRLVRLNGVSKPMAIHRAGFTMLEAVLSTVIIAAIMMGIVGVMFLARNALAGTSTKDDGLSQGQRVMQMITTDLSQAITITEQTDKAVTMTVPDRTGDGQPETIRYAWSGTAGATLTRQVNGGTVAVLAQNVYQFKLTYLVKTITGQP